MKKNAANILRENYINILTANYLTVFSFDVANNSNPFVMIENIAEVDSVNKCKGEIFGDYRVALKVCYRYQQKASSYKEIEDVVSTIQQVITNANFDVSPDFTLIRTRLENADNQTEDTDKGIMVVKTLIYSHLLQKV